jgi:hypothetical protein
MMRCLLLTAFLFISTAVAQIPEVTVPMGPGVSIPPEDFSITPSATPVASEAPSPAAPLPTLSPGETSTVCYQISGGRTIASNVPADAPDSDCWKVYSIGGGIARVPMSAPSLSFPHSTGPF